MTEKAPLFTPVQIGPRTAPNRMVINAMECCDALDNGDPGPKTLERYRNYFQGRAGVVFLEAITITAECIARKFQLSILPHNQKALERFTAELKRANPETIFIWQLSHAGELASSEFSRRMTPNPLPGYGGELMTEEDVARIIDEFVLSAKIAHDCGADGIDFKLCHGYLGSAMLRPHNNRKWKYGGPWENRVRFAYESYERITKEINDPDFLIGSKVSLWEGFPGGQGCAGPDTAIMDLREPLDLIKGLEERGAKFILVSAGSPSITLALVQPDRKVPDYGYLHHYFQKLVKDTVGPKTVVMGSAYSIFRDGKNSFQAVREEESSLTYWGNKNIREGVVDMVAIGRQSLADCHLPAKLMEGRESEINWCTACDQCIEFLIRQKPVGCAVYAKEYRESLKEIRKAEGRLKAKRT